MREKAMMWSCVVLAVLMAGAAWAQQPACAKTCPAGATCQKKTADGWIALFDGKDLNCWQNARKADAPNKWFIEDGAMTNENKANDIGTKPEFKDFELQLEYKTVKGGNSGVYLRGRVEIQVLDSFGKQSIGKGDDGAIYAQFPPLVNASKPVGEWNQLEVTYVGDTLTAKLNGQVIHDKQKITAVTGGALPGGVNDPGPLMLQGDHQKVWYRNVKIRPIEAK